MLRAVPPRAARYHVIRQRARPKEVRISYNKYYVQRSHEHLHFATFSFLRTGMNPVFRVFLVRGSLTRNKCKPASSCSQCPHGCHGEGCFSFECNTDLTNFCVRLPKPLSLYLKLTVIRVDLK